MRFFANAEKAIKENGERGLIALEFYAGINTSIYRQIKTGPHSRVHGPNHGREGSFLKEIVCIFESDDFFDSDAQYSGGFELGFAYSRSQDIVVGDTLKIESEDGKTRRYKVESLETIGLTTEIWKKWKISNLGD